MKEMVKEAFGPHPIKVDVWSGKKILIFLAKHVEIARHFGHFITPGHILSELYQQVSEGRASLPEIIRYFVVTQFDDHQFTKLDQAGSSSDLRPSVHDLFVDLPFSIEGHVQPDGMLASLCTASEQNLCYDVRSRMPESWRAWSKHPKRARVTLIKGGPGQGKSTVAQYLCQINRAWLMLAQDGPKVIDATRATAENVRAAAQRDGFWPTSARIPIQVELKEYAHWYSQHEADSKTVLAYLADTLSKKINCRVLAKALKEALSRKAWIVVFDGLDEVPNDFKDKIAKEVLDFLNDVLIEKNADVLAICTSRPQGYSGQFGGIDGPVADLTQLDADKAMECARPVLKFGRTTDESERSIQVLEAAIGSSNVRELMTTPLQSHIMAVVVRDGGRPPDKRWRLFDNFYTVMKRRESLKSFANPRIERLLREEDRLLRAVHVYLGFVLHARAERSEGAQTTLSRTEFRQLVHDVVARLVDRDIEETVSCLMEATTERLVLVSTPESGEHVRFDIRQLQEFFAAEFIYSGVDAKELETRIETIGGDAHWREVVHFLMSALIENQRTPELAIAVQVLRRLNEGDEASPQHRLYHRRMNRGGWIACRLLMEGVLEQDQRDRLLMRPLLDAIGGVLELESLSQLKSVHAVRSRQWLIQFLSDKVATANATEYVGALMLLGWVLSGESMESATAVRAFMNAPVLFQERVCSLWVREALGHRVTADSPNLPQALSPWVVEVAVSVLNARNWTEYSGSALRSLLSICLIDADALGAACRKVRMSDATTRAITILLGLIKSGLRPTGSAGESYRYDLGLVRALAFHDTWLNGKVPGVLQEVDASAARSETGGVFKFMFTCLWTCKERGASQIAELAREVREAGPDRVGVVASGLLALVPITGPHDIEPFVMAELTEWHPDESGGSTEGWGATLFDFALVQNASITPDQCILLSRMFPRLALDLAFNYELVSGCELSPVLFTELTMVLDHAPTLAARYILQWGHLQTICSDRLENIKRAVSGMSLSTVSFQHRPIVTAFKLRLPADVRLLPFLAAALVGTFFAEHSLGLAYHDAETLQDLLSEYGLRDTDLSTIAESEDLDRTTRAGAAALYWWAYPGKGFDRRRNEAEWDRALELYSALVAPDSETWLTRALIRGVLANHSEREPHVLSFVTGLLQRGQDGSGPREALAQLLTIWRERSLAPVHEKQALQKWLGYSFQVPDYAKAPVTN